jgi:spore coat polysaccharide biosynthesis predicted glycosyltransferase SpsG
MAELPPLVIRCDASSEIGFGHLMRCRAIAREAGRERQVLFATCDDTSNPLMHDQDAPVERKREGEQEEEFLSRVCRTHAGSTVLADLYHPYAEHFLLDLARHCSGIVLLDTVCPGLPAADRVIYPAASPNVRWSSMTARSNMSMPGSGVSWRL